MKRFSFLIKHGKLLNKLGISAIWVQDPKFMVHHVKVFYKYFPFIKYKFVVSDVELVHYHEDFFLWHMNRIRSE